jgi:hypothetical protein
MLFPTIYIASDHLSSAEAALHLSIFGRLSNELGDLDPNYYGIVEQLVLANAKVFFGCYISSLSSYVTRLRGYRGVDSYYFDEEHTDGRAVKQSSDSTAFLLSRVDDRVGRHQRRICTSAAKRCFQPHIW